MIEIKCKEVATGLNQQTAIIILIRLY